VETTINFKNRIIKYDLHIHSTISDGTCSPYEIIEIAKNKNLKGISITDHDEYVEDNIYEYAKEKGIIFIPAIEFSTKFTNVHIIGYNLNWQDEKLENFLKHQREERKKAIIKMCEKGKRMGLPISFEEIIENINTTKSIGRPHIANILVKKGYVKNIYEAFKKYLYTGGPIFEDYKKYHYSEIINLIEQANGVSVLAHPGLIPYNIQERVIIDCIKYGIKGIEVFYPRHSYNQIERFYSLAQKYGLFIFGGSDFHGEVKPDIQLGDAGLTEDEFATLCQHIFCHSVL